MEIKNLSIQQAIVMAASIIAVGFMGAQYMKQTSIEKQQQIEIQSKINENEEKLDKCLEDVETEYEHQRYLEDTCQPPYGNGQNCFLRTKDTIKENRLQEIDLCYRRYPI